jgi:hypothetical protein
MRSIIICNIIKYYWGDQIKDDNMGRECGMSGKDEKCIQKLVGKLENPRGERPPARPGHGQWDIKINLKQIICYEDVKWINLALGMGQ